MPGERFAGVATDEAGTPNLRVSTVFSAAAKLLKKAAVSEQY
jgi:hypothetical protein